MSKVKIDVYMKIKFVVFVCLLISTYILFKATIVSAYCGTGCFRSICSVCDPNGPGNKDDKCVECGEGGLIYGQCVGPNDCYPDCCSGGQCKACGTDTPPPPPPTCPVGEQSVPAGSTWMCCPLFQYAVPNISTGVWECSSPNWVPMGDFIAASCNNLFGWTCDFNDFSAPLDVHFYKDGPAGVGTLIGTTTANGGWPGSAVGTICTNPITNIAYPYHEFNYTPPASMLDGVAHTLYAYAINTPTNPVGNPQIADSNDIHTITCALPVPINLAASCGAPGTTANFSWTSGGGAVDHYAIRIYDTVNGWSGTCISPDTCADVIATNYAHPTTQGHTYGWWIHSVSAAGGWSAEG